MPLSSGRRARRGRRRPRRLRRAPRRSRSRSGVARLGLEEAQVQRLARASTRIAVALNSAVPERGSVASIVSTFVVDLVGEVQGHEREAGAQVRVERDRRLDRAAPRGDARAARRRRGRSARASSGETRSASPPTCSGELKPPVCTPVLYDSSRRPVVSRSGNSSSSRSTGGACSTAVNGAGAPRRGSSQSRAVQELVARVLLVRARPLDAAELLEPRVAHARVHRRERAQLVPDLLGDRCCRVGARGAARARTMISMSSRASPGGSSALRTRCTRRSLEVTVPSDSRTSRRSPAARRRRARRSSSGRCPGRRGGRARAAACARVSGRPPTAPGSRRST